MTLEGQTSKTLTVRQAAFIGCRSGRKPMAVYISDMSTGSASVRTRAIWLSEGVLSAGSSQSGAMTAGDHGHKDSTPAQQGGTGRRHAPLRTNVGMWP